ncbi:hypothetical protein, partial [uncultured Phascolarctobacterium sp.]|uniref:hypothetical protein n=1 Tax=uncultured Phascolarctobacterium sp. TaxID=512296 RepID=UPI00260A7289
MGKGFGFLALAVLAGVTMPSFAIAAPVDTQQQIIAIYEKIYRSKKQVDCKCKLNKIYQATISV